MSKHINLNTNCKEAKPSAFGHRRGPNHDLGKDFAFNESVILGRGMPRDRILCLVKQAITDDDTTGPADLMEKNQELRKIEETLHLLEDQLMSVDAIIKKKDKVMEEATKSSMELHQVMQKLQNEYSLIKQNFLKV